MTITPPASFTSLEEAIISLVRGNDHDLESYIVKCSASSKIETTLASCHLYHIKLDGNHRPMTSYFLNKITSLIIDYAIPRSKAIAAKKAYEETGSTEAFTSLSNEARTLFSKSPTTGENGELILFLFAERLLKLPQLFSKMYLKTNSNVHVHGTDALHAGTTDRGNLALYWGESKLKTNWKSAINESFRDIAQFLRDDDGRCGRDIKLLCHNIDLLSQEIESAILSYLTPGDPNFMQCEYRGIVFVGFDHDSYKSDISKVSPESIREQIVEASSDWNSDILTKLTKEKIDQIHIDIFLLPFPSVEEFRKQFLKQLGITNDS